MRLGVTEPARFAMEREPLAYLADESLETAERARVRGRGEALALMLGRFVLLLHHLDALMHVAAGLHQIVVRLGDFVLIELLLRLREIELVLNAGLGRIGSMRERFRELLHVRAVSGKLRLRPGEPLLDR